MENDVSTYEAGEQAIKVFWSWFTSGVPTIGPLASVGIAIFALMNYRFSRRKEKISAIDSNLDILQRLNEVAVSSNANLLAAISSVHFDDEIKKDHAREIFFIYLRINRMLRAFEYCRHGIITKKERDRIVGNYCGTLKQYERDIHKLIPRGYPSKFSEYLAKMIAKSTQPPKYDELRLFETRQPKPKPEGETT